MADEGSQRCKYVGQCTLYKSRGRASVGEYSALSEDVRQKMCENISADNDGVPCVPGTGGIGGGGAICEAYFARKTIDDLLKTAQATLSDEKKKTIPGKGW
jgi:hypothetical protein